MSKKDKKAKSVVSVPDKRDLYKEFGLDVGMNAVEAASALPGQIALVGLLLAEANAEVNASASEFTRWSAYSRIEGTVSDPKMAQWRAQAKLEGSPEWAAWQARINDAREAVDELNGVQAGLRARLALLTTGIAPCWISSDE